MASSDNVFLSDSMPLIPLSSNAIFSQSRPSTSGNLSSGTATRRKKKRLPSAFSLEDIFNQLSNSNTSNLSAPVGNVVLTPRSAEACLRLGVNPEILKIRDIESFWESGGIEPLVQRMRHETYAQRRQDTMRLCRNERKRITNAMFESAAVTNASGDATMNPDLRKEKALTSTLVQLEMAKIVKVQQRQEKELGQMIKVRLSQSRYQIITPLVRLPCPRPLLLL